MSAGDLPSAFERDAGSGEEDDGYQAADQAEHAAGLGQCGHRRRLGFDPFPDRVQVRARLGHIDDVPGPEAGGSWLHPWNS